MALSTNPRQAATLSKACDLGSFHFYELALAGQSQRSVGPSYPVQAPPRRR